MLKNYQKEFISHDYCHIKNFNDLIKFNAQDEINFKKFWDGLSLDQNFKDYTHRERRILRYIYEYGQDLKIDYNSDYNSSVNYEVNYKQGINKLTYVEDDFITNNILKQIIKIDIGIIESLLNQNHKYMITLHLFRVSAVDGKCSPTTSGIHKDGMDFICMHYINAQNINPVTSKVYKDASPDSQILNLVMDNFLESIIVNDNKLYHSATEITQIDLTKKAFRDLLLVTFKIINDSDNA